MIALQLALPCTVVVSLTVCPVFDLKITSTTVGTSIANLIQQVQIVPADSLVFDTLISFTVDNLSLSGSLSLLNALHDLWCTLCKIFSLFMK